MNEDKLQEMLARIYARALELGMEEEQQEQQPPLKTLEQYRRDRYMLVVEFAAFLGIAPHTYYKILRGEQVRITTMRQIAAKLGVHPSQIAEFASPKE